MQLTMREMLDRLIGFDTVSAKSNLDLIEFVKDYFAAHGVPCELVYNPEKSKANLYALIAVSYWPCPAYTSPKPM